MENGEKKAFLQLNSYPLGLIQQHIWDCLKDSVNEESSCSKELTTSIPPERVDRWEKQKGHGRDGWNHNETTKLQ